MKISYNWLKWYIPEAPEAEKLVDVFTYHLCEVESVSPIYADKKPDENGLNISRNQPDQSQSVVDYVFDINILPNRAHDLLSHQGVARELASLLNINFVD